MFDIGWTELVVIGVVALVVIGPKDLPDMFRTLGRFTGKARSMARDFQRAMETAANEAGVKDVANEMRDAASGRSMGLNAMKDAAAKFEKWDPMKTDAPRAATATGGIGRPQAIPDPAAPAAPRGAATQALADKVAAESAARLEAAKAAMTPAPTVTATLPPLAAEELAEVAVSKRRRKPASDPLANAVAATKKPRAKKFDA